MSLLLRRRHKENKPVPKEQVKTPVVKEEVKPETKKKKK